MLLLCSGDQSFIARGSCTYGVQTAKYRSTTVDSVCQRLQCTDICRPKIQQLSDFLLYASWQWHSDFKNTVIYQKQFLEHNVHHWRHNVPTPLQVDNIFVFIRQVAPVPAYWLFKTSATSWPLTFWPWQWCPSHVWRGQF